MNLTSEIAHKLTIKGIGNDIVEISRIHNMIQKYDHVFLQKIFTDKEIKYCSSKAQPAIHFAGRWAVKEAFYKALPTNIQKFSTWKSIQVLSDQNKPYIDVCSQDLSNMLKEINVSFIHVSISHERTFCTAMVILS